MSWLAYFFQFDESLLRTPGVNASTCSGLGYADADSGLRVALKLSILHTGSSITAGDIETSLLEGSVSNEDKTKKWRKANGDSITVDSNGIIVQVLEDIGCSPSPCKNGGTCILDEDLYEITCRCSESYEGEKCENDITQVRVKTGPQEDKVSGNTRLFIILGLATLILVTVVTGLCCLLLKWKTTAGKGRSVQPFLSVERPINMRKRPLLTTVPEVVRNPAVEQPPQTPSYSNEAINYDDLRMRKLQQTFMRMGGLESVVREQNIFKQCLTSMGLSRKQHQSFVKAN
ncbi:hypothetical protein HOLleu_37189 [Holothuria leucospilota]|uniref:EGF-like domain-containing protein n=1 Tax=Holothuria leucospilota TaxID=206669 RepID=A0A9Q1BD61_HOLLE|nr:hypothetical protein HOLleu_37189 [Holothuria leucospilota]